MESEITQSDFELLQIAITRVRIKSQDLTLMAIAYRMIKESFLMKVILINRRMKKNEFN